MKREWMRAYRHYGLKLLLIPILIVVTMWVGFNQYMDDYLGHRDDAAELVLKLDRMKKTIDLSKEFGKTKSELMPSFYEIPPRSFRFSSPEDSLNQMENQLNVLLQSLYFDNIKMTKLALQQKGHAMELVIDSQFTGVPQQLPRLEAALLVHQMAMRISSIEIKVLDDSDGGGPRLDIHAKLLAIHLEPDEIKSIKPFKPAPAAR